MKILEIFYSIDGEGKRAGELAIFIRLSGCNLKCSWCDTAYSQNPTLGTEMSINEIISQISQYECKNITVTGGEPLIHKDIKALLLKLSLLNYNINVETNGSQSINGYKDNAYKNIWFTMDYKCKSSMMQDYMDFNNFLALDQNDVLKFVVADKTDLDCAFKIIQKLDEQKIYPQIYLSPVFEKIKPVKIIEYMKKNRLTNCRLQLQLHKLIWDKNKRGV